MNILNTRRGSIFVLTFVACTLAIGSRERVARASFTPGVLVVYRIGDGQGDLADTAQAVFIDEYDSETGELIASHPLPTTGELALTLSNGGKHDGHVNLSTDGRYVVFAGYRADVGDDYPVDQLPSDVPRVIGRLDSEWNIDTSTGLTDSYDRTDMTAVASDDGWRFWTTGDGKYVDLVNGMVEFDFLVPTITGGLRYIPNLGATASINVSQTQTIPQDLDADLWPDSIRSCRIVGGQLYIDTPAPEAFGYRGAYATTDPLPTSGAQVMIPVITNAPPSTDAQGKFVPKSDVILLDLSDEVAGIDTAYSTGGKADYQKWSLVNGAWVRLANKNLLNTSEEINSMSATVDGGTVILFAISDQGIYRLDDAGGYNADLSATFGAPLITPQNDTAFRGIALIDAPCQPDGDSDHNGHIDLADFAALQGCFSEGSPIPSSESCVRLDGDCDGYLDLVDYAAFEQSVAGP